MCRVGRYWTQPGYMICYAVSAMFGLVVAHLQVFSQCLHFVLPVCRMFLLFNVINLSMAHCCQWSVLCDPEHEQNDWCMFECSADPADGGCAGTAWHLLLHIQKLTVCRWFTRNSQVHPRCSAFCRSVPPDSARRHSETANHSRADRE